MKNGMIRTFPSFTYFCILKWNEPSLENGRFKTPYKGGKLLRLINGKPSPSATQGYFIKF